MWENHNGMQLSWYKLKYQTARPGLKYSGILLFLIIPTISIFLWFRSIYCIGRVKNAQVHFLVSSLLSSCFESGSLIVQHEFFTESATAELENECTNYEAKSRLLRGDLLSLAY